MNSKPPFFKEIVHSYTRRAQWHNYYDRAIYMVTISKHPMCHLFGILRYQVPEDALISPSILGEIIMEQIKVTPSFNPEIEILNYIIMPDHLHVLMRVKNPIEHHFGDIIQAIKGASTSKIRKCLANPTITIFEEGFNDRIIKSQRQLNTAANYIRRNPYRLAVRRAHPDFFRRINRLKIGDRCYQAYGNLHLMDNPFKEQVIIHRSDTPETLKHKREVWLYTAANGGVLVSPFISSAEKAIRTEADEYGSRFILIINEPMPDRYKPSGHDFDLCESGRMLIISANLPGSLSRQTCISMNSLAETISSI